MKNIYSNPKLCFMSFSACDIITNSGDEDQSILNLDNTVDIGSLFN